MKITGLVVVAFLLGFTSCSSLFNDSANEKVVAEVYGNKLKLSQLEMVLPPNLSEIDSISFAQNYIEKWVRDQLLLEKAVINLDKQTQKNIEVMIENYRTSLLLYKYQQIIIRQKLDTVVTPEQIAKYYGPNAGNFKLDSCVVKSIYIQLPKSTHDRYKVRAWLRSQREEDIITLEDYCYQNARSFNMGENWQYFGNIISKIPKKINSRERFLKSNRYIETTDSLYAYYVAILDYKLTNDTTPAVFVTNQIRDIIINHRKVKLIDDLENNIYNDAVNQKKFVIYPN